MAWIPTRNRAVRVSVAHQACSGARCGPVSVPAKTSSLNRDRSSAGIPGMLCAVQVHWLLVFRCLGHYHAIIEGPGRNESNHFLLLVKVVPYDSCDFYLAVCVLFSPD